MARAIEDTMNRSERALQMAEQARAELAKYTWKAVREQWNAVYAGSGFQVPVPGSEVPVP
jgi:hypothetical protein